MEKDIYLSMMGAYNSVHETMNLQGQIGSTPIQNTGKSNNTTAKNDSQVTSKNSSVGVKKNISTSQSNNMARNASAATMSGAMKPIQPMKPINTTKTESYMDNQRYHSMRDAYKAMYENKVVVGKGPALQAAVVLPKPSVTKVNIEVNKQETKVGDVEQAYYTFPAGFDPTNREDVASKSKKVEYTEGVLDAAKEGAKKYAKLEKDTQKDIERVRKGGKFNYKEEAELEEGMHRDAKTGEVTDKAVVGRTYYPNMPKKKTSVAIRKEKSKAQQKAEAYEISAGELMEFMVESGITDNMKSSEAIYLHMTPEWMESIIDGMIEAKK